MSHIEIEQAVIQLAAAQAGVDPASVNGDTSFASDLNYDSLDRVEFVMTLEEKFELAVADERAEKIATVGQACELVTELLGASARRKCVSANPHRAVQK